ncbi:MAG TPA: VOC family protein [Candidatus Solibacter sp.]|nr:VOC family protein [Candidatus Solibacter sp.]
MQIEALHHVSIPVSDIERAKRFYGETLGLQEMIRPPFDFPGAWFHLGPHQALHLIVHPHSTFRTGKGVDSRDIHYAIRVKSYRAALEHLRVKGFREDAAETDLTKMRTNPHATAGFPQIYILDPDRNVIEINAERLE